MLYKEQNIQLMHLYQCAKIARSLQYNMRQLLTLGLWYFYSTAIKKLIINYTFLVNSFMAEVPTI